MANTQTRHTARRSTEIRLLETADAPALSAFLLRSFGAPQTAPFASTDMIAWKYLAPSRDASSYIADRDGRIVAHAGVLRATVQGPTGESVQAANVIDWAADIEAPGAGVALYRHAMRQAEVTYLIGGTAATRVMADRLGFRRAMVTSVFSRWVRPVGEFLRRPTDSRSLLRLVHGLAGAPFRRLAPRRGLTIARVFRFDEAVNGVLASNASPHAFARRSVATLNHRLGCPARLMRGHVIVRRGGAIAGVAVSSVGDWDAKILLLHLDSSDVRDWSAAYALVTDALAREQRVCRVAVIASAPTVERALGDNHFWKAAAEPVLLYDPGNRAPRLQPIDLSYFDTDLDYYNG